MLFTMSSKLRKKLDIVTDLVTFQDMHLYVIRGSGESSGSKLYQKKKEPKKKTIYTLCLLWRLCVYHFKPQRGCSENYSCKVTGFF